MILQAEATIFLDEINSSYKSSFFHLFLRLGYVQASKRDKKFATCAPNFSYAALCECLRRVFIYRQPLPVDTVLFNRKQGRQVGQVAKQQVANLDTNDPVLGFRATNERLFVLTANNLFVLKVNN